MASNKISLFQRIVSTLKSKETRNYLTSTHFWGPGIKRK